MAKSQSAEASGNTVVVEDIGPCRKKLTITVPADAVSEQIEQALDGLAAEAALPGFRPGRAPRRLVERKFGDAVRRETKGQVVSSAYSAAVQEHKLAVVGEPEGNEELEKLALEPGKPATFSVTVEIAPEFELPDLTGLEVRKPLIEPTNEQVDEQVQRLSVNEGDLAPQEVAEPGDYCIGHGIMRDESGNELLSLNGSVIQVPTKGSDGKGAILGILVDDFGKQVGLPKPGDVLTVKAKAPEGHEREEVRGKNLTVEFRVEQVQRIMPASIESLVAKYGMESEQQLREAVTLRLNQRALVEQQMAMRQQIARHLLDTVDMDLPERLSARQAERNLVRARVDLMYRGWDETQIEKRIAEMRSQSATQAQRELKLFFILARIAEQSEVSVTEEEVLGRIAQMAAERGERPEALRREIVKRNQIGVIVQQIREHKTLDMLLSKAKVSEVSLEEFNASVRELNESGRAGSSETGGAKKKSGGKKKAAAKDE